MRHTHSKAHSYISTMSWTQCYVALNILALTRGIPVQTTNNRLPQCDVSQEQHVQECGGGKLITLSAQYSGEAGILAGNINSVLEPDHMNIRQHPISLADDDQPLSPQAACQLYADYTQCIQGFAERDKCWSWVDESVTFMWSYLCDPSGGLPDFEKSGECLILNDVRSSLTKQLLLEPCLDTFMEFMNTAMYMTTHSGDEAGLIHLYCTVRNVSSECFAPAFERVCGVGGAAFITHMYDYFGDMVRKELPPTTTIKCSATSGSTHLAESSTPKVGKKQRNVSFAPTAGGKLEIVSSVPAVQAQGPYDDLIKYYKLAEKKIRDKLGACSQLDEVFNMVICLLETMRGEPVHIPSIPDMEQLILHFCATDKGGSREMMHECMLPHYSPCKQMYFSVMENLMAVTCDAHLAVAKDKLSKCYWPTTTGSLGYLVHCNMSVSEAWGILNQLMHISDYHFMPKLVKLLTKPSICFDKLLEKDILSRLPPGCSADTRAKVKVMYDESQIMTSMLYSVATELVSEIDRLQPNGTREVNDLLGLLTRL